VLKSEIDEARESLLQIPYFSYLFAWKHSAERLTRRFSERDTGPLKSALAAVPTRNSFQDTAIGIDTFE
jgi:hypothetical protein